MTTVCLSVPEQLDIPAPELSQWGPQVDVYKTLNSVVGDRRRFNCCSPELDLELLRDETELSMSVPDNHEPGEFSGREPIEKTVDTVANSHV